MSWTLPTELDSYSQIKAAIKELFQKQIDDGYLYYRDAPDKESRLDDRSDILSSSELASQCSWLVLRNAIYLLCQCSGNKNNITELLSGNLPDDAETDSAQSTKSMMENIEKVARHLKESEVSNIKRKNKQEIDSTPVDTMDEDEVSDDTIISIINGMPSKQLLRWISYSINTNIIPFRYEMHKLIGR